MLSEAEELRSILSMNIKRRRKSLDLSQERLAERAELSVQTINDIEGKRMWVSDKTIARLARALQVEAYQLLVPAPAPSSPEGPRNPSPRETFFALRQSIQAEIDRQFEEALKRGLFG